MPTADDWWWLLCSVCDSARADKDEQANIRRGLAALDKVLNTRATVHRAMYRQGLGWVDFEWGDEGGAPDKYGKRQGGKGISHAMEARQRKDGLTQAQSIQILRKMVNAIARGQEIKKIQVKGIENRMIRHAGAEVSLVKSKGSNAWILTVYDAWN